LRIVYFTHSLRSCWNHGNAHFLRGVLRALQRLGHDVVAVEPRKSWSLDNLVADHGWGGLDAFAAAYPDLPIELADPEAGPDRVCDNADLVIVHEWNDPALVAAVGRLRRTQRFTLLFHDTHHRAVSEPDAMAAFDLSNYDGVLAFGETLAEVYRGWGWGGRVWVWHEAADTTVFHPPAQEADRARLVWIGNWGDGERSRELEEFLLAPSAGCGMGLDVYGVRYPPVALASLKIFGARYRGWLPNAQAPDVFARHLATVHVPRRFYLTHLPGIPTIRVFEALACGIPLVSAPWSDCEGLFRRNVDFLMVQDGEAMRRALTDLREDRALREDLRRRGLETIRTRHTCDHRAAELMGIVAGLRASVAEAA
jgi:spore maturation protein CgeB